MKKNIKAALLSAFVFPGLGQIYQGNKMKGLCMIVAVNFLFLLALLIVLHALLSTGLASGLSQTGTQVTMVTRVLSESPTVKLLFGLLFCLWLYGIFDALLGRGKNPDQPE